MPERRWSKSLVQRAHLLCGLAMAPQPLRLPGLLPQQLAAPLEQVAPLGAHPLLNTVPKDGQALGVREGEAFSCRVRWAVKQAAVIARETMTSTQPASTAVQRGLPRLAACCKRSWTE